ncbi:endonuclease/exonuclease/phosphatase family protein [uncultured Rikenella sp.]|uniref:endonuclease/exonuclease/phosphatase family protein n=1 Tax=uncultured Rikenella sp. TaxID=368003 RepID=UPI002634EFCB|nr:endonuclease/exonuclease/phosphatase family protein [uncultured Rikenella sp.]
MSANRNSAGNEYYYIDQSRPVNLWRILLDLLLVLLTLGLGGSLVMAYLSTGISPERNWIFAFFGLGAPFLYLGNIVMLLVWIIRWRWWALVPAVTLLLGIGHLGTLVQIDLLKEHRDSGNTTARHNTPEQLAILTYNVHGFSHGQHEHKGYLRNVDSIAAYIRHLQPDVICFQEYETMQPGDVRRIDSLYRDWPYRSYNFIYGGKDDIGYGTAVFSRLPILGAERTLFEYSSNSMLRADLQTLGGDTVRVFNNHLQSTQIDEMSRERVERLEMRGDPSAEQFVRSLGSRLKANYRRRAVQVDTVSRMIAASPYSAIVVGDFNDTPVSYTYKKMRGELEDPFINAGTGFAYTYNRLFSMLRIDYIFHSPLFETLEYRSDDLPWSDHNPVFVRLQRQKSDTGGSK